MRNSNGMEMKRSPVEAGMHTWGFRRQHLKNTAESSTFSTLTVHALPGVPKSHKTSLHGLLIKLVGKLKNTNAWAILGDFDLIGPGTST